MDATDADIDTDTRDADPASTPRQRLSVHRRDLIVSVARSSAVVVGLLVVYFVAPIGRADSDAVVLRTLGAIGLLLVVVIGQTIAIARSGTPVFRAIEGVVVILTLVLVTSAATYLLISANDGGAFTEELDHVGALYLSMMTMTTVGFGDIGALTSSARVAVMVQMGINVLVLTVAARSFLALGRTVRDRRRTDHT